MNDYEKERLIHEIKKRRCLYDKSRKDFNNQGKKADCWRNIGLILNRSCNDLKKEWKNLKKSYRLSQYGTESGRKDDGSPFRFGRQMSFLAPHMNDTVSKNSKEEQDDPYPLNGQEADTFTNYYLDETENYSPLDNEEIKHDETEIATNYTDAYEVLDLENFFISICNSTKELPRLCQIRIKKIFMDIICRAEENYVRGLSDDSILSDLNKYANLSA